MSDDQLQDRLNNGIYGTPKIKAAEQKKFLGTFRERVQATLTFEELKDPQNLQALKIEIAAHPEYILLVSGDVPQTSLQELLVLGKEQGIETRFTATRSQIYQPDDLAVVFASKNEALHQDIVDITALHPHTSNLTDEEYAQKKKSFWQKLFS